MTLVAGMCETGKELAENGLNRLEIVLLCCLQSAVAGTVHGPLSRPCCQEPFETIRTPTTRCYTERSADLRYVS